MYGKIYKFPCHATRQNNKYMYINMYMNRKIKQKININKEYLYDE